MTRLKLIILFVVVFVCFISLTAADDIDSTDTSHDEDSSSGPNPDHTGPKHAGDPDISTSEDHYGKDGQHDEDFDHEAVTGSHKEAEEIKELEPAEAKKRLAIIFKRIDANNDSFVTMEELTNYIIKSLRNLDEENAKQKLEEDDENKDNKVTWPEFVQKKYGYTLKDIKEFEKEKNKDMQNFLQSLKAEQGKYMLADQNNDGQLDLQEYTAFVHPRNYPHMAPYEIGKTLEDFDNNKDGLVDFKEFIGYDKNMSNETKEQERKHFTEYDVNQDGFLDKVEIKAWAMPGFRKTAEAEAKHLFKETDKDKDKKLTSEETIARHDLWVGSQATDYGKHLEDLKKEEL